MEIFWNLVDSSKISPQEPVAFLSPAELAQLTTLRFAKRRNDWLLGRIAAKSLVQHQPAYRCFALQEIEIHNTPEGAPYISLPGGILLPGCLSISHSHGMAFCALVVGSEARIGADLERIDGQAQGLVDDFFTPHEQELVMSYADVVRDVAVTLVWSAKEAMLKALGVGLRRDTRRVEIKEFEGSGMDCNQYTWQTLQVVDAEMEDRCWVAWWQRQGDFVLTLAGFIDGVSTTKINWVLSNVSGR